MKYRFNVSVPFVPITLQQLDSSSVARLPDRELSVAELRISPLGDGYEASVVIEEGSPIVAKRAAVERVGLLLRLLALRGHVYEIQLTEVQSVSEGPAEFEPNTRSTSDGLAIAVDDPMFVGEHIGVVKRVADLDFESGIMDASSRIPDHLFRALELNQLAVSSLAPDIRLVLSTSVIEVLAGQSLGSPPTVLSGLKRCGRKRLRKAMARVLSPFVPDKKQVERLLARLFDTHAMPVSKHLHDYLGSVGVNEYSSDEVAAWWRARGRLAHGSATDTAHLATSLPGVTAAAKAVLRAEINKSIESAA